MKKTLIAIAALAATSAFAQSTVTISGNMDAGYVSHGYKGVGVSGVDRNITSTSGITIGANTDLGGGLRAMWSSGTDLAPTGSAINQGAAPGANGGATSPGVANIFANAQQMLAITGGSGTLQLGSLNNAALGAHNTSQPFGTAIGGGFGATSGSFATAAVRLDNSLRYVSPAFGGGFTASVLVRKPQAQVGGSSSLTNTTFGTQHQAGALDWNFNYNAGPLNAMFVRATNDGTTVASVAAPGAAPTIAATAFKGTYTALAANYKFGATTAYGGYQLNKGAPATGANILDRQTVTVGFKHEMGVNTFMGSYQRASNNLANAVGFVANGQTSSASASNLVALGYEYALSKTAALTARYERIGDSANLLNSAATGAPFASQNNASDRTRMGVGLRLAF